MPVDEIFYRIVFDVDDDELNEVERTTERLDQRLRDIAQTFGIMGAALVGFAGLAVREFTGLDSALARTRAQIGLTDAEMQELEQGMSDLGDIAGSTRTELEESIFPILSAGQRGAEALETLEIAERARAAQFGRGEVITRFLTSAVSAFTTDALDAARAGDVLASSVRVGNFEAQQLVPAMQSVNAQAATMGISIDEVGASMAAMSLVQSELSRNATGFRAVLGALTRGSDQAQQALARAGLTIEQVRDAIAEDFLGGIALITSAVSDQSDLLQVFGGNVEALNAVNSLLATGLDNTRRIFDEVRDSTGALDEAYDRGQNSSLDFVRATAEFRDVLTQIGAVVLPLATSGLALMRGALEPLTAALESNNPIVRALIQGLTLLGVVFLGIAAIAGTASVALASYRAIASLVVGITRAWTGAQWLLNIAMTANPIGLIIAGIAALIAGIALLIVYWDNVTSAINRAWQAIRRLANILPFVNLGDTDASIRASSDFGVASFQRGGIVPGPVGAPMPAVVHGGELIVPAHQVMQDARASEIGRSSSVSYNFASGSVIINTQATDAEGIADEIERELGRRSRAMARSVADDEVL